MYRAYNIIRHKTIGTRKTGLVRVIAQLELAPVNTNASPERASERLSRLLDGQCNA